MQNRADETPAKLDRCANVATSHSVPWWDPSWFPPMKADASIAVFAFDFRDFGESEKGLQSPAEWAKDALAAFKAAAKLEGVDAARMVAIGASIGADGAPDACLLYNQAAGSGCIGALSLSPGNYLGMGYANVVSDLAGIPVWCLAGEKDTEAAPACSSASSESYRSQIYSGSDAHGMVLISPNLEPQSMDLIQEFLGLTLGESVK